MIRKLKALLVLVPVVLLYVALVLGGGKAEPEACRKLSGSKRTKAAALLGKLHAYDCCDKTLKECLSKKSCALVTRLARDVCQRVDQGQDKAEIQRAINRRGALALPTAKKHRIETAGLSFVGAKGSPVTAIAYLCPRCPYCARMAPLLHREVTEGRLKGKVRFGIKLFPLRSHPDSVPGGLAALSAQRLGKFWPFLLGLYEQFDSYDAAKLPELGASRGLDAAQMRKLIKDPSVRAELVESKKEGVRNGVDATPAIFIDGRHYTGDLDVEQVIDVLEEAHERATGKLCR